MSSIRVVSDAGPLIWLARCGILWMLEKLYGTVFIPTAVFSEVVEEGVERNYPDAQVIKKSVDQGWIKVKTPSKRAVARIKQMETRLAVQLGKGEREAIALGIDLGGVILTNDQVASNVAKMMGIDGRGILFLLLLGVQMIFIDKDGARQAIRAMLQEGFWLSPDHVRRFYEALEQIRR